MVTDVLNLLSQEAGSRRIRVSCDFQPDLPRALGDAVQMSQVVLNLVHNAFDSCSQMPPEQRLVGVATRLMDGSSVELCVRDSGAGISPEVRDRLFSPFFTTKQEGLGMGLRLSRTIVGAHGGTINGFNNPDGDGATFRVVLPLVPDTDYSKV